MEPMLILLATILAVLTSVAWHFMYSLWLRPKKLEKCLRNQGFQGNSYRTITGDLSEMMRLMHTSLSNPISSLSHDIFPHIMPFVNQTIRQYGTKSFIWYGRKPRINVTDPDHIKEIFTKYKVYQKEHHGGGMFGLATREGEDWAKIRRILNPAFHVEKLKIMLPVMDTSCEQMLKKWEDMVSAEGSAEIDVWASLCRMSGDVIAKVAFGTSYVEGMRLFQLQDEAMQLSFQKLRSVTTYIPGWRAVPTKANRRLKVVDGEIRAIMKAIIHKRKEAMKTGKYKYKDDLLGIMLESNEKEIEDNGVGMTMNDVIMECKLFHLAGTDTTAGLLTWTMMLLSQHQVWQTKAREEVLEHYGMDKSPDFEGLNHLKIVTMILNETLRFYPPATSLSRMVHQNTKLKDISILHGTEMSLAIILVHRDPKLWGQDANEFNPSRFAEGVSKAAKVPGSFLPFGGGPRVCIR